MKCPVCNGAMKRIKQPYYECKVCTHIYRVFTGDYIAFHANTFRSLQSSKRKGDVEWKSEVSMEFHAARDEICQKRIAAIKPYITTDFETALDIGSGAGTFARKLVELIPDVECNEVCPELIKECERLNFKTYPYNFFKCEFLKHFDLVTAWHVAEHIPNVARFVRLAIDRTLKTLIIEVPVNRRLSKVFGGHTQFFNEKSFKALFWPYEKEFTITIRKGIQKPALMGILERKPI